MKKSYVNTRLHRFIKLYSNHYYDKRLVTQQNQCEVPTTTACYCYVWKNYISRARLSSTKKFTRVLPSVAGQASFPTQNIMNIYPNHHPTEQLWPGTELMTYELPKLWKPISDRHTVIIRINSPLQDAIKTWEVIRDRHPIIISLLECVSTLIWDWIENLNIIKMLDEKSNLFSSV
jgi:hypothetical protein